MVRPSLQLLTMRRSLVALALAVTLPLPGLAAQVTVKDGETLSEIAERHGVSLTRLMQVNGIHDADLVEAGRTLKLPGSSGGGSSSGGSRAAGTITVKEGETLSEIAERHSIGLSRLMQINGISDADQVQAGQTLRLQGAAPASARSSAATAPSGPVYPRGASEHVVRSGESLSVIASGYGVAFVPRRALALYRRKESLVTLPFTEHFEREVVVLTRKHRKLPAHVSRFVENILF